MKRIILTLIKWYQKTISFDNGLLKVYKPYGVCKFFPTCSEYAYQAIQKQGIIQGVLLSIKRLIRCNPWTEGGVDEI